MSDWKECWTMGSKWWNGEINVRRLLHEQAFRTGTLRRERHTSHIPRKDNGTSIYTSPWLQVLHTDMLYKCFCKTTCKIYWNLVDIIYQDLNPQSPSLLPLNLWVCFNKKASKKSSLPYSPKTKNSCLGLYNTFFIKPLLSNLMQILSYVSSNHSREMLTWSCLCFFVLLNDLTLT